MLVKSTEVKLNFGKYLQIVQNEDVVITKNGKVIAKMVKASEKKAALETLDLLTKNMINDEEISLENIKNERLKKYEN